MKIIEAHKYWYPRRGAERYVFALSDALQEAGHEVIPFSMQHAHNVETPYSSYFVPGLDTDRLNLLHVPAYFARAFWSRSAYRNMHTLIQDVRPDLVHVHNLYTHLSPSVLWAAKKEQIPVVATVHDYGMISANYALWSGRESLYPNNLSFLDIARSKYIKHSFAATAALECIVRMQRMLRLYDSAIDRYIAVSEFVQEVLVASGISREKIEVLHPFSEFDPSPRADIPHGFFYAGALDESKGVDILLEAFNGIDEPLYIAGDGPLKERVLCHPGVKYLGVLSSSEISIQLAHVRAAIIPSVWDEPFGLTALEAMLAGTPVIGSDRGGLKELLGAGEYGIMIEAGNMGALRHAVQFVKEHHDLVEKRAKKAAQRARLLADPGRHVEQLVRIFEELAVDKSLL